MLTLSKHAFCGAALKYTNIINSLVLDGAALKRANVTKTRVRNIRTKHPPINELFILIDAIIINGGRKKHMYKCFISAFIFTLTAVQLEPQVSELGSFPMQDDAGSIKEVVNILKSS